MGGPARIAAVNPPAPLSELLPHPARPAPAHTRLWAGAQWISDGDLALHYELQAPAGTIVWPPAGQPGPADGLWQTTCFEAFVSAGSAAYHEFNFSPSGQWAFYRFSAERQRSPDSTGPGVAGFAPALIGQHGGDRFTLQTRLPVQTLPAASAEGWQLGLTAVLQASDGTLSYWAWHHPVPDRPDFHHPGGRTQHLPLFAPAPAP